MSKYIKIQDALNVCRLKPIIENGTATGVVYPTPEEIIKALSGLPTIEVSEDNKAYTYCSRCGMRVVVDAPSVTTEQSSMVGEWIKEMHTNIVQIWKCDQCAEMIEQSIQCEYPRYNFCPNCGARMKGVEKCITTTTNYHHSKGGYALNAEE